MIDDRYLLTTLAALGVLGVIGVAHLLPSGRAVRARNALLLELSGAGDFSWRPPAFPEGFRREPGAPDRDFLRVVESLRAAPEDDRQLALALASHLAEYAKDKGPVRADPLATYNAIREGYGYCADFVKVYLVMLHAAGLDARQWAFSFDGFGGHGHTVVEVFDRQHDHWFMVDVYNNFHVADAASGEPLGVLEYRDALLGRRADAVMRPNGPGRPGFVHAHKALAYYRNGVEQWYLWWGNAVLSYYRNPVVKSLSRVSRTLAHLAGLVAGIQPRIHILATPENATLVRGAFALRRRLQWIGIGILVLSVLLGVEIALARAAGRTFL